MEKTAEALIEADPDVLVMTEGLASVGGVDGLVKLPGVAQTDAGVQGRVIAVDDRVLLSFGARTPSLVAALRDGSVDFEGPLRAHHDDRCHGSGRCFRRVFGDRVC